MEDAENNVVYAGFWLRLSATVIDLIIVFFLITLPVSMIYGADQYLNNTAYTYMGVWHFIIEFAFPLILTIWLWLRFSATPGKMTLKLKIVDIKTSEPISFWQAIIRYVGYLLAVFCLLIGIIWIAFDKRKQGWHDKLASTAVIRVNK